MVLINKDKLAVIIPISAIALLGLFIVNIENVFPTPSAYSKISEIRQEINASPYDLGTSPNFTVTVIEFSDFQCPACAVASGELEKAMKHYGSRVNFVFKHFPVHDGSDLAAEASECARDQGKFWEYGRLLFSNLGSASGADLSGFAADLELDMNKFSLCLQSGEKSGKISADFRAGYSAGIKGTPTFYINGIELVGARSFEEMKGIIDGELE